MTSTRSRGNLAALVAAAALAACSAQGAMHASASPQPAGGPAVLSGVAKAQADSARYPYTAADIHFMSGMISHHAQAIVMARWAPTHGAGPAVRTLAERIINAQTDEIALMQQWLRDRRQPVPEANPAGMKMTMGGTEHVMLMPGMLSEAQLKQLDQAQGREFDRLFLIFMIQHHRGAVSMVKELFDSYGAGQDLLVFKFASDVNIDQTTEVARMEKMLVALITTPQ
jgi:uncharacterized protein (DUF305 family)